MGKPLEPNYGLDHARVSVWIVPALLLACAFAFFAYQMRLEQRTDGMPVVEEFAR